MGRLPGSYQPATPGWLVGHCTVIVIRKSPATGWSKKTARSLKVFCFAAKVGVKANGKNYGRKGLPLFRQKLT